MSGDGRAFLKRVALAYGLIVLLMLGVNAGAIAAWRFPDPDDALRLVQVRDLVGGQGWYDLVQHRVDPGHGGVVMHWSRLVDMPLAAAMLGLRPVLGAAGAEHAAMVVVPLITLAALMLLVARVAWERLGPEAAMLSALVLAMSPTLVEQIRPMRIDHHGWQVVANILAMNGLMTRHARLGGWISGVALAIGLSISLEGLPLVAVFGVLGVWRWLRGGETKLWLVFCVQALAVGSALCFAATRAGDLAQHCDAVAPVHLAVLAFAAVALSALARARGAVLLGGFAAVGVGALAIYFGLAPQCRAGSFEMLSPLVRRLWLNSIAEGLPIWRQSWAEGLQIVVPALVALRACGQLIRASTGEELVWWQEYTLLQAGALAVALMVARAGATSAALAAVPLAWQVAQWRSIMREGRSWRRLGAALVMVVALVPAAPITLAPSGFAAQGAAPRTIACAMPISAGALARLPQGTILAPLDMGPELLLATPHSVLATGHHRGARGMHEVIDAFTSAPDTAHAIIRGNGVAYVALCSGLGEAEVYAHAAPQGLAADLLGGRAPDWLAPVSDQGLMVWHVTR